MIRRFLDELAFCGSIIVLAIFLIPLLTVCRIMGIYLDE